MRARPDGRVILLGARGSLGRLTATAMVRQGLQPVLAGRDESALLEIAEELAVDNPTERPLEVAIADTESPESLRALLASPGDVLVSTVGPFTSHGEAPIRAATDAGCGYLDSSWEPPFIRRVFSRYSPAAAARGAVLLPAFGCYYTAGALAATIAVRRTMTDSRPPARVDIGYFVTGSGRASAPGNALIDESFRWRDGRLQQERPGSRVRTFELSADKQAEALSLGTAEHFTVPRLAASITTINVYVGWFGRLTRAAAVAGSVTGTASKVPGFGGVWDTVLRGMGGSPGGGPNETEGSRRRTVVVAETFDADGNFQQRVRVEGPPPYPLTASLLSWGAGMLLQGAESGAGALGPAEAFGTEALIGGCMALGLAEIRHRF
jgi:short subunit dehydrogenase-like uncharacterized protein